MTQKEKTGVRRGTCKIRRERKDNDRPRQGRTDADWNRFVTAVSHSGVETVPPLNFASSSVLVSADMLVTQNRELGPYRLA